MEALGLVNSQETELQYDDDCTCLTAPLDDGTGLDLTRPGLSLLTLFFCPFWQFLLTEPKWILTKQPYELLRALSVHFFQTNELVTA